MRFEVTRKSFEDTDRKPDSKHSKLELIPDGLGNEIEIWTVHFEDINQLVKFFMDEGEFRIINSRYPTCTANIEIQDI